MSGVRNTGFITARINEYVNSRKAGFHTPGHKGDLCASDITELGVHGEIFPADSITNAEKAVAELYGAKNIRFLTGGSSMGIKAALYAFKGQKVLYASGVHRAFTEGCALWEIRAVCANGNNESDGLIYNCSCDYLPAPITLSEAECALNKHKDAKALFITSPDYFGRTADVRIAELCGSRCVKLIVDSAHGAHFAFAGLRDFSFESRADACNMSAHKTLGAYTQSALTSVNDSDILQKTDESLKLLGTTSPNYVMLARLEESVYEASGNKAEYARLKKFSRRVHEHADCINGTDYTRICVRKKNKTGKELFYGFVSAGIMPEAAIGEYTVFILTPYDNGEKLDALYGYITAG